jgi:zinc protease
VNLKPLAAVGIAAAAAAAPASAQDAKPPLPSIERDAKTGVAEAFLPNGLRILVLERHGVPVVSHQVWYKVGANDERPGETGLAHYLEHVLFKGTKQIEKGRIDLITFQGGGANNATTWRSNRTACATAPSSPRSSRRSAAR